MKLRRVQQPVQYPHHCAVIPFKGGTNSAGFIDTGVDIRGVDPHVYISLEAAVEIAKEIGWVGPSAVDVVNQENAALRARNEQLEAELEDEKQVNSSIEFLGTKDFIARQKRGPKKKEQKDQKETSTAKAA